MNGGGRMPSTHYTYADNDCHKAFLQLHTLLLYCTMRLQEFLRMCIRFQISELVKSFVVILHSPPKGGRAGAASSWLTATPSWLWRWSGPLPKYGEFETVLEGTHDTHYLHGWSLRQHKSTCRTRVGHGRVATRAACNKIVFLMNGRLVSKRNCKEIVR